MTEPINKRVLEALRGLIAAWPGYVDQRAIHAMQDGLAAIAALEAEQSGAAPEPVAHLWQHCETGRTRIVMPDQVVTADATWLIVGPLYLHPPATAQVAQPLSDERVMELVDEADLDWHKGFVDDCNRYAELVRLAEAAHGIKLEGGA